MSRIRLTVAAALYCIVGLASWTNLYAQIALVQLTDDRLSEAFFMTVSGQTAFVCDFGGLEVLDVSNPASPTSLTNIFIDAGAVAVLGNYAYVGENNGRLDVYDISNPANPFLVGSTNGPSQTSQVYNVFVVGHLIYMSCNSGLYIFSIPIPVSTSPIFRGIAYPGATGGSMSRSGHYLYVANGGLTILDVSIAANPTVAGVFNSTNAGVGAVGVGGSAGNILYVAFSDGLYVLDISNPTSPTIISHANPGGTSVSLSINGNYAYLGVYPFGFLIYDISTPSAPVEVARSTGTYEFNTVIALGPFAYVVDGHGLNVFAMEPQLQVNLATASSLLFNWAAPAPFVMQQSASINPANWVTLTNTPTVLGASNQMTLPVLSEQLFYRLKSM